MNVHIPPVVSVTSGPLPASTKVYRAGTVHPGRKSVV